MKVIITEVTDLQRIIKVTKKWNAFAGLSQGFSRQAQHTLCSHPFEILLILKFQKRPQGRVIRNSCPLNW